MSLSRHTTYNLVGAIIPVILALVTVPAYLLIIGPDRFGVLSIAWILLGYFGLFDLGLGRATAQRIAAYRDKSHRERADVFWAALSVNVGLGVIGALILWPVSWYFFGHHFKMDEALRPEVMMAVPLLSLSVPVATSTGVMMGALQGRERFLETNMVSVTSTTLFQIFPLLCAWLISPNLSGLLVASLSARIIALVVLWRKCHQEFLVGAPFVFDRAQVKSLLSFGVWVTVTSLFGPLLVIVDRFAIGAVIGALAVTLYTVPFQLSQRLTMLPNALVTALFPKLSAAADDSQRTLATRATDTLIAAMTPMVLGFIFILSPFLQLWVGHSLGTAGTAQAAIVGKIIALAFWVNAFAIVPYATLQARGRPDLVSKILLLQIPFYLAALWFAMIEWGIVGAAVAFAVRCGIDFLLLSRASDSRVEIVPISVSLTLLMIGFFASEHFAFLSWQWLASGLVLACVSTLYAWKILPDNVRELALGFFRKLSGKAGFSQ